MKLYRFIRFIIIAYIVSICSLVLLQKHFIFKPPSDYSNNTPKNYNLDYQEIKIKAISSDESITAWWMPQHTNSSAIPSDPDLTKPAVLYLHGNGADLSKLAHVAPLFYNYGWNTLMIDYRGYGKSDLPIDGLSEESMTLDALSAFAWLKRKGFANNRIVVWGHSLGSAVATDVALEEKPAVLVLEGAFNSILQMAKYRYWFFPIFPFMLHDKFDTESKISSIRSPVLSIHADQDTIVPYDKGVGVFSIANEPKKLVTLAGVDHNSFPDVEDKYRKEILSFINKYLI